MESGGASRFFVLTLFGNSIKEVYYDKKTYNQLSLIFGTLPVLIEGAGSIDDTINLGIENLKERGLLETGDMIVLSGGASALPKQNKGKVIGGCVKI